MLSMLQSFSLYDTSYAGISEGANMCFFTFYNQAIAIIDWNGLLNKERRH